LSEENFIVSARKYRPESFDALVGQHAVAETLLQEINSNKLAQAFLFTGPRGVGKTTSARILAKLINQQDGEDENVDFSFNIFELDAASRNGVEDMRALTEQVRIPPARGKYKVYIIDEVHMLSAAAFNAFLKTLEEPPPHAIFILATTEKHKVLPTILSRCQVFNFNRIEIPDIVKTLRDIAKKEDVKYDEKALYLVAQKADGGMRDALSLFDQLVSFTQGDITYAKALDLLNILDYDVFFDTVICCQNSDMATALLLLDGVIKNGFDGQIFLGGLAAHLRNLMICKNARTAGLLDVSEDFKKKYMEQADEIEAGFLLNALELTNACDMSYKTSRHPRLLVELLLMKLTQLNNLLADLDGISDLKKKALAEGEEPEERKYKTGAIERPVSYKSLENSRFGQAAEHEKKPEAETDATDETVESTEPIAEALEPEVEIEPTSEPAETTSEIEIAETEAPVVPEIVETISSPVIEVAKNEAPVSDEAPVDLFAPELEVVLEEVAEPVENAEPAIVESPEPIAEKLEEPLVEAELVEESSEKEPEIIEEPKADFEASSETEIESEPIKEESIEQEVIVESKEEQELESGVESKEEKQELESKIPTSELPNNLNEHWAKFVATFPVAERVVIESPEFRLEGPILTAIISTGAPLSSFEEIQFAFASFTRENPLDEVKQVVFEKGIIKHDDSKPYTESEKVEYLRKKHPLLNQMIDDWKLH